MGKEIKGVGGEAGNDNTMEAKAEEGFQWSCADCLSGGWWTEERMQGTQFDYVPAAPSMVFSASSRVSIAANHQAERDCWFGGLVLDFFNRDRAWEVP